MLSSASDSVVAGATVGFAAGVGCGRMVHGVCSLSLYMYQNEPSVWPGVASNVIQPILSKYTSHQACDIPAVTGVPPSASAA